MQDTRRHDLAIPSNQNAREIPSILATLASYENLFGPYHPQTLSLTAVLAMALCASGNRSDGRRLVERAMLDFTRHHGRFHPLRTRILEAWSALLCQEADWRAALPVQRELLECRTHLLGDSHPDSLAVRDDLSATLYALTCGSSSISA
jgi:hypothetical protein